MFDKKIKKIVSCILALAIILTTIVPNAIFATTPDVSENTEKFTINTYHFYDFPPNSSVDESFINGPYANNSYTPLWRYSEEYAEEQDWTGGYTLEPYCFRTSTGEVTYCLNLGKASPENTEMTYDETLLKEALNKVIKMGYPNKSGADYNTSDAELEWATAVALKIVEGTYYNYVKDESLPSPLTLEAFTNGVLDKTFSRKYYAENQLTDAQIKYFNGKADFALDLIKTLVNYSTDESIKLDDLTISAPEGNIVVSYTDATIESGPYKINFESDAEAECVVKISGIDNYKITDARRHELTKIDFNQEFYIEAQGKDLVGKTIKIEAYAAGLESPTRVGYSTNEKKDGVPYQTMYVYETVTLNDVVSKDIVLPDNLSIVTLIKTDKETGDPLANAEFVLKDANGNKLNSPWIPEKLISDTNGKVTIMLPLGEYIYQETKAPEGYIIDNTEKTFNVSSTNSINIRVKNTANEVILTKTDLVSGEPVPGATIEIKDADGNHIVGSPFVTNENGEITIKKLPVGTYTFKETIAPDGYILNEEECTFTINENGNITGKTILTNEPNKVEITKTDLVSGKPVPGATIEIKDANGNHIIGSPFVTDENGKIVIEKLPVGTYTFKETIAPDGYILNEEECTFTIDTYGNITGITALTNEQNEIEITKTDLVSGEPVPGATIEIKDANGTPIAGSPFVTDENGKITIKKLPVGTYTFKETIAPDGYILNEEECVFTVDKYGIVTGTNSLTNKQNEVILTKTDLVSGEPVPGATIEIKDSNGTPIAGSPFVTDENGKITIKKLPVGTYTFKETIAPDGYILNEEECVFTIDKYGIVEGTVSLTNKPNEVILTKTDLVSGKPVPGATIEIKDVNRNPIAGSPFVTDENGEIKIEKLPVGTYTFKETIAPDGYIINEEECEFNIDIYGKVTGKTTLTNKPIEVTITKTDLVSGEPVPGATIEIKDVDGNHIVGSPFVTDENGEINLIRLPAGEYTFKETIAPAGYIINEEECIFIVDKNGEISGKTTLTNEPNSTVLTKVDLVTGEPVPGATIEIKDADGNQIIGSPFVTDENGEIEILRLPAGEYVFKEIIAPDGYILNEEECTFTMNEDGSVTGTTILRNKPMSVTLTKVDALTKEPLANAHLGVYNAENELIAEGITSTDGTITFYLHSGNYTVKELKAPEGYIKTNNIYTFTINKDGSVEGTLIIENNANEITLIKTDILTSKKLPNALIEVKNSEGKVVFEGLTNEKGEIRLTKLPVGTYTFKELEAPEGYILSTEEYKFTVNEDGEVTGITAITNKATEVTLIKLDKDTQQPLEGAKFEIKKGSTSIGILETNKDGKITLRGLAIGDYTFEEIESPKGYALDNTVYTFTINKDGSIKGTTTITNTKISVKLFKKDLTTGKVLEGATFVIKDKEGNTVLEGITDKDGKIVINKIAAGQYTLQETVAPKGYELNTSVYTFTVNPDGTIEGTTTIYNKQIETVPDEPSEETTETTPSEPTETPDKDIIETGDYRTSSGVIFLMIGLVMILGFITINALKKKENN